jgi:cytochrome c556
MSTSAAQAGRSAARYFFIFLVGLLAGVVCTVMAMRALEARKDHFHESVMHVQQWHMGRLKANMEQSRCNATDTLPHLQALRTMADDIEPAFPDLRDDERFAKAAGQLRAALDSARANPPLNCAGVGAAMQEIGAACKACHQDFRG